MSKNIIDIEENYAPNGDFAGSVILRESGEEIVICEDEWPELRAKIDRAFGWHDKLIVKPETYYNFEADGVKENSAACSKCGELVCDLEGSPIEADGTEKVCLNCKHVDCQE